MSPRTDMTDFPHGPDTRRRKIASILALGLFRVHCHRLRTHRESLTAAIQAESSPVGRRPLSFVIAVLARCTPRNRPQSAQNRANERIACNT